MKPILTRIKRTVAIVFLLFGAAWMSSAADTVIPLINFNNVPLPDAIKNLARQSGVNYILDPHVNSTASGGMAAIPNVTASWTNVSAQAALNDVLAQYKLTMVVNPVTSVTRIAPAGLGAKPVPASQVATNSGIPIPLISMEFVPLDEAVKNLASQASLKVTFDPDVSAPAFDLRQNVSLRWEQITARQALAALLDNYGLVLSEDAVGSTVRIRLQAKN